ncbi:MAG TPA: septum formation initiator family protein [Anaeromyxobacter sp.]|jgi:cell division protein FtsB|nr:septum formation initiator family protein [Anaeromyxobacter sp.]
MKRLLRHRVLLYLATLGVLLALSAADPDGLRKALHHAREAERLAAENASLEQNVVRLRREVKALSGDPAALERAAREELGYVKPGEIVYRLDEGGEAR